MATTQHNRRVTAQRLGQTRNRPRATRRIGGKVHLIGVLARPALYDQRARGRIERHRLDLQRQLAQQHMGRGQRRVAAQIDLAPRGEPAQAEPVGPVAADQEGGLRQIVLARQRLHPAVVAPRQLRLDHTGAIAHEGARRKGIHRPLSHPPCSTFSSGQRATSFSITRSQSAAIGRVGLGRMTMANTSSRPKGAATVSRSSASSRAPTAARRSGRRPGGSRHPRRPSYSHHRNSRRRNP